MYSKLIESIQTTDDLNLLKGEVEILKNALYGTTGKFEHELSQSIRKSVKERILSDLTEEKIDKATYLKNLEAELEKVQIVKLTLAYEPSGRDFASIYQWFLDQLGSHIVIDVFYNPGIIAGAVVSYNGKYYDGSLKKRIGKFNQAKLS